MADREMVACSLSGAGLTERLGEWSEVARRATRRTIEEGRIVSRYPLDETLLGRMRDLIAAEAQCCPFMEFTIREHSDELEVELRVPEGMSDVVAVMLGLVTERPAQSASA